MQFVKKRTIDLACALQQLFPNAAPWFRDLYGSPPDPIPSYTTLGNPAGLIRIDEIFGINLYHKAFKISPVVFGALPSVHSSTAMCCALFFSRYLNKAGTVAIIVYTAVMFWSTMVSFLFPSLLHVYRPC